MAILLHRTVEVKDQDDPAETKKCDSKSSLKSISNRVTFDKMRTFLSHKQPVTWSMANQVRDSVL